MNRHLMTLYDQLEFQIQKTNNQIKQLCLTPQKYLIVQTGGVSSIDGLKLQVTHIYHNFQLAYADPNGEIRKLIGKPLLEVWDTLSKINNITNWIQNYHGKG